MMKCVVCIERSLDMKDISTERPFQEGVDGAKTAVTVKDGQALCVTHLHEGDLGRVVDGRR